MMIVIPKNLQTRLREIERDEGIPPIDFVIQALEVWTQADAEMRKGLGLSLMRWKLKSISRNQ